MSEEKKIDKKEKVEKVKKEKVKKEKVKKEKVKKEKVKKDETITNKVTLGEKISLKFRKLFIVDGLRTFLIVAILLVSYVAINLAAKENKLPKFDITENKIYTITEASKKALSGIDQDVKIYAYGFEENSSFTDLLDQYKKVNEKISYEILTEESNLEMVKKYDLSEGYFVLIIKSGDSEKVIDASTEFTSYDYTTYQTVDTTEQVITNSILGLTQENKPKVYLTQGHQEYGEESINRLLVQLANEAFEVNFINLATVGTVPEDCDVLAIISPAQDFMDVEVTAITDYINRGGKIFFSMDVVSETIKLANLQKVLDLYGVSVENGYVFECAENQYLSNYNYIYMPQVSSTSSITKDIYTDSYLWLVFTGRLNYRTEEELQSLNVTKETLLSSSPESMFITDLSDDINKAIEKAASQGMMKSSEIASSLTKKITKPDGTEVESKLIIASSASFISDYVVEELNQTYPLSFIGSNIDFVMNSISELAGKDNILTIRKEYNNSTYTPTNLQNIIVILTIILVPLFIIIAGILVGVWRKRRK